MTSKVTLQATRITQPKAGQRIKDSKGKYVKSPSVCRDGDATPAYHPWEYKTLNNFLSGKQIQCGRQSSYHCNLKTVKWIKGYRNTCPIAGCCGTFNRPAPLILDKFNFVKKGIKKKINISGVNVSFQHHVTGVDVGASSNSETKKWAGYFPFVDIILYHCYTKNNKEEKKEIQKVRHKTAVPLAKNGTVSAKFTKKISNFNPQSDNLQIEINYSANGGGSYSDQATNPSIIYATQLNIQASYTYVDTPKIVAKESSISLSGGANTIVTDPRNPDKSAGDSNCRNTITDTIRYINTTADDIIVSVPQNVKYTKTNNIAESTVKYEYQDISGVEGRKEIVYSLKSNNKQKITKSYTAVSYSKPTVLIQTKYLKNHVFSDTDKFIEVEGTCWNTIDIYLDGNTTLLISFSTPNISQSDFFNKIKELDCGSYELYVYIDDKYHKKVNITIKPPVFSFSSNLRKSYSQSDTKQSIVTITRTDSNMQDIDVTIIDTGNTEKKIVSETIVSKQSINIPINRINVGKYELKCEYYDGCSNKTYSLGNYVIKPPHKQSYDNLVIRAKNENVEFTSIAIREGDNYQKPITYTKATLINSVNDIVLFGKDGMCNVGDLGYAILGVKNNTQHDIKNISIELNPIIKSEDEYNDFDTGIMQWKTGILQAFNDNFFILNPAIKNTVQIFNIQNQSLINEGTENVVLHFSEIKAGKHLEIKIPYFSAYPQTIFMEFLVLGEVHDFVDLDSIKSGVDPYKSYTNTNFMSQLDKKAKRGNKLCISLSVQDAFSAELSIEGDDLDRNDLTNTNDLDIEYKLSISESECDNTIQLPITTQIINDARLIPTAYQFGKTKTTLSIYEANGKIKDNITHDAYIDKNKTQHISIQRGITNQIQPLTNKSVYLRYLDKNNQVKHIRNTTDSEGHVNFHFVIPEYYESDDGYFYLEDILDKVDIIFGEDNFYKGASYPSVHNNDISTCNVTLLGFYYTTTKGYYVSFKNVKNSNIENVKSLYLIGQLTDSNNNPLDDKIIEYHNKTDNVFKQYITGNIPDDIAKASDLLSKDIGGYFAIPIYNISKTTYNLNTIKNNSYVCFGDNVIYEYASAGQSSNQMNFDKATTSLSITTDYNRYRRGETIIIQAKLLASEKVFNNVINLNQYLNKTCSVDFHIFYKTCSEKNTEGWKTTYKIIDGQVLPTQAEEFIYCNVDTDLKIYAKLEKNVVENHNVNVLSLKAVNGYKPNKNVTVKGMVAPNKDKKKLGDYLALTAIDIDKDGYLYDRSSDILYWNIGDMDSYETKKCNIILEAEHIGHNIAYVCGFDYLTPDMDTTIHTALTIERLDSDEIVYIDEAIPIRAKLTKLQDTQHNVFGNVTFYGYYPIKICPKCDIQYPIDATTCTNIIDSENNQGIECTESDTSQNICGEELEESYERHMLGHAEVREFNGEYYAQGYVRLKENNAKVYASYDGMDIFSIHYTPCKSNIILFDNVQKHHTNIVFNEVSNNLFTNENIQISAYVEYTDNDKTEYLHKKVNIKFFVENQEIYNIKEDSEITNDNKVIKKYIINFAVTQAGDYTIRAYMPETEDMLGSSKQKIIKVQDGERL